MSFYMFNNKSDNNQLVLGKTFAQDNTFSISVDRSCIPSGKAMTTGELTTARVGEFIKKHMGTSIVASHFVAFPEAVVRYAFHCVSLLHECGDLSLNTINEHLGNISVRLEYANLGMVFEAKFDVLNDHCNSEVVNVKFFIHLNRMVAQILKNQTVSQLGFCTEYFDIFKTALYVPHAKTDVTTLEFAVVGLKGFGANTCLQITGQFRKSLVSGHSVERVVHEWGQNSWFELISPVAVTHNGKYVSSVVVRGHFLHGFDFGGKSPHDVYLRGDSLVMSQCGSV